MFEKTVMREESKIGMMNPYLPSNVFIPDGEPCLFDGRIYLYGSQDLYGNKALCAGDYVCWSAPEDDITNWRLEGVIYERMQDPYIKKVVESGKGNAFNQYLYAPNVAKIENQYYLYYGVAISGSGIGVAAADTPVGPFRYLGRVRYPEEAKPEGWRDTEDGIEDGDMALGLGIPMVQMNPFKKHFGVHMKEYTYDPAVLYDEGRLYLYYGCGYCQMVELSMEDKRTVLKNQETGQYLSPRLLPSVSEREDKEKIAAQDGWHMGNGPSIRKIGELYYLSYYAVNNDGCHAMCYSTAPSPFGPFIYRGVLVSLGNGAYKNQRYPSAFTGNTHGGMIQVQGRWYQNYHRHTGDKSVARQACMTELVMNPDGTFRQAEFKSQIMEEGGLPYDREWPAYCACVLTDAKGRVRKRQASPYLHLRVSGPENLQDEIQVVTGLSEGCIVGFKYLEFAVGHPCEAECFVKLKNFSAGRVEIYLDDLMVEHKAGEISLPDTGGEESTLWGKVHVSPGRHALYYRFYHQKRKTEFLSFGFNKITR